MSRQPIPNAQGTPFLVNQSMAATFVSPWIDTWQIDGTAWEGIYTGTPTGTLSFETTNRDPSTFSGTATTAPAATPALTNPAGAGGQFLVTTPGVSKHQGFGRYQRLRYAATSGAGVLNLYVFGTGAG